MLFNRHPSRVPQQPKQPLIPENYLDAPSQRLYYLSLGLLCQAIKLLDFLRSLASPSERLTICVKWLFVDFLYCFLLSQLRIPRLNYSKASVLLQICLLWFLDGIMFGGISLNVPALFSGGSLSAIFPRSPDIPSTPEPFSFYDVVAPFTFGLLSQPAGSRDTHLLGQHTVRMSPISTAQLNPQAVNFCLSTPTSVIHVPVLLNNTNLSSLKYSITPLGYPTDVAHGKVELVEISAKDIKAISQAFRDEQAKPSRLRIPEDRDEYDDDDESHEQNSHSMLQKSQSMVYLRLARSGTIRLEHVLDVSGIEARLSHSEVVVVPCPEVAFVEDVQSTNDTIRCAGQDTDIKLMIDVRGVPPLSIRWLKIINGVREQFLVEGIETDHRRGSEDSHPDRLQEVSEKGDPSSLALKIPLTVSLDEPGTYVYALEEITDGVGNVVRSGHDLATANQSISKTRTTRSFVVLRKPAISFDHCSSDAPTPLLIGSEATLSIKAVEADDLDAPWEVYVKYQPLTDADSVAANKRLKPWKKTLKTQGDRRELNVRASSPGEYTIAGVKGKWCSGTVLAPYTCTVVERALPSAEIEWKRIHECSGDTGVSASLILRGTPPFQVHYRMQRDNEPPREFSKQFTNSRGELTLQPERSGHYTFTFVHLSDANYRKVELHGPSIDQLIHPLASADFSDVHGVGRSKKLISSCDGDAVDVHVDLKGTGPWNLDLQIIGPHSSETVLVTGIEKPREIISVSIPEAVRKSGGTFEVDLVSVEDAYKCRRSISVPGVVVNVKRVRPTARFYGSTQERHTTITEGERASLPLRLTGDGPWCMKYRRIGADDKVMTLRLNSPNDYLHVTEKGVYEIIDIVDSQCSGSTATDATTYTVDWLPRPVAKLSPAVDATYDVHNGSFILRSICEGLNDHVDLELSGRPPFQIMYNVAQGHELGGTQLMDQPTFNSLQPRTRFQLHTSSPGRMYYEVKQIGDSAYPLAKHANAIIPRSQRLLFEQQVSMRPSAHFKNRNRMTYCLYDAFVPLDSTSADGIILLEGAPPFTVTLSIKNLAASQIKMERVVVSSNAWKIDLPSYSFMAVGAHIVTIESVTDASNCAQSTSDPLYSSIWVDVAETAAIIPFERREDICVGGISQFQLEGIPPWTIGYRINGKSYTQEAKVSPFSLLQQQSGEFTVTHIAHQQKMCKAVVTDLRFVVHPLPSAQVGHGKRVFQDIHEGDQAEIVFTLIGEPPFTFTYQRSEPSPKKGGKPGKVLETHTVSRVLTNEYSIFSALEGTWTVTSISDRYCRYPPAQPDSSVERQRH